MVLSLLACAEHLDELRATLQKQQSPILSSLIMPGGSEPNQNQKTRRGRRPATTCETISRSQRRFSWRCPKRIEAEIGETMRTSGPSKLTDATALYCEASLSYFVAELNEFSGLGKGLER
jgi:hypothetical protein